MRWLPKFRFSLRTLMILTAVLAVASSMVGKRVYEAHRQQQTVEWILEHGGFVRYEYQHPLYTVSKVKKEPPTPKWIRDIFGENYFEPIVSVSMKDVKELSPCSELKHLESFQYCGETIPDLSPLANLENLQTFNFWDTSIQMAGQQIGLITDISQVSKLKKLRHLSIASRSVTNLTPLEKLVDLQSILIRQPIIRRGFTLRQEVSIDISNTPKIDLTPLSKLKKLQSIIIPKIRVTDFSPLKDLDNLEVLNISGHQITDISPLSDLTKLRTLGIPGNSTTDLSPLSGLTKLKMLGLSGTSATDISPLTSLINLEELHLSRSKVKDLTPLVELPKLKSVMLYNTEVDKDYIPILLTSGQLRSLIKKMPDCRIHF